jgi:hypothetical protein
MQEHGEDLALGTTDVADLPSSPTPLPTISRRGLLAYAVSAPTMTVAAGFGINLAMPGTAQALP